MYIWLIVQCSNPISRPLQSHQSPPSWFRRWADEIAAKRRANAVKKVQLWWTAIGTTINGPCRRTNHWTIEECLRMAAYLQFLWWWTINFWELYFFPDKLGGWHFLNRTVANRWPRASCTVSCTGHFVLQALACRSHDQGSRGSRQEYRVEPQRQPYGRFGSGVSQTR